MRHRIRDAVRRALPERVALELTVWWSWYLGQPELCRLRALVPRRGNSIDAGANRGVFSYVLSGLSDHVYAYEPIPDLARFIRRSAPPNVRVFERALSNHRGEGTLTIPLRGSRAEHHLSSLSRTFSGTTRQIRVRLSTLDEAAHRDVAFVKIDVEGHESQVIEGARETIREFRPTLLVEIEQRHAGRPVSETIDSILEFGYRGCFLERGEWIDIGRFSYPEHQERHLDPHSGEVISSRYVNNFVFSPR